MEFEVKRFFIITSFLFSLLLQSCSNQNYESDLELRIINIEKIIKEKNVQISKLENKIYILENNISDLDSRLRDFDSYLSDLENRISNLESNQY